MHRYIILLSSIYFRKVAGFFFSLSVAVALVEYMTGEFFGKRWVSKDGEGDVRSREFV